VIRPPRMFVTDVASCSWLSMQMDPHKTVLIIDEPTMGADQGGGQALGPGTLTHAMVSGMLDARTRHRAGEAATGTRPGHVRDMSTGAV